MRAIKVYWICHVRLALEDDKEPIGHSTLV